MSERKWREITTIEEWQQAWEGSAEQPFVLLKHSTTCPVSANALEEFEGYLEDHQGDGRIYYLVKVIESRPVSNRIAEDIALKHESPQIMWIKGKEKVWSASHWAITYAHMDAVLS